MIKVRFIFSVILFTSLFLSCKKEKLPEVVPDNPKFSLSYTLDGEVFNFEAGNSDYYMYSNAYFDSIKNIGIYTGQLKQRSCSSNCGYALAVLINDVQTGSTGFASRPNEALKPGTLLYNDLANSVLNYSVTLIPQKFNVPGANYKWTIDDGVNVTTTNAYSLVTTFSLQKKYRVTFEYIDPSGNCVKQLSNVYNTGNSLQSVVLSTPIQPAGDFRFSFASNTVGKAPYRYYWNFGDGQTSELANPVHQFSLSPIPYEVSLKIIDANLDTCVVNKHVIAFPAPDNYCEADFNANFVPIFNPKVLGAVTIVLTDKNGDEYSSADFFQPSFSQFEILSVESYNANESGQPTKKITARFNCKVKKGAVVKSITNAQVVFALAYK